MLSIVEINMAPKKDQISKHERGVVEGGINFFRLGAGLGVGGGARGKPPLGRQTGT